MKKTDRTLSEYLTRREFIKKTSLGFLCAGLAYSGINVKSLFAALAKDPATKKGIMYYRKLGKTDLLVSEIAFNGGRLTDPAVLSYAMDLGINYVDTAPAYGDSELNIAKILKYRRNDLIVATKWEVNELFRVKELEKSVETSLKRLEVETIDIIQVWAAMRKTQVTHEPVFEAFDKLKKAGKVKYLGITTHRNEIEVSKEIIKTGRYDMMLAAYHYLNYKQMGPIIEEAVQKNIGVIGQLITEGSDENPELKGNSSTRAAAEWALKNTNLTSVLLDMPTTPDVDELARVPGLMRK